jgi:uncharacterized YkwD family protein/spore coat assembly protein SafA
MLLISTIIFSNVSLVKADNLTYTVKSGDSIWKIAVQNETGVSEIISCNPSLANPNMIFPGQKLLIPNITDIKNLENEVIRIVNVERANRGLTQLSANWQLSRLARYKSADMVKFNYFSHYSPTYGSPFEMMTNFGIKYSAAGENIAMGQPTPKSVMTAWMNSPGHKANILSPNFKEIGVGVCKNSSGQIYWTQEFISR